MTDSRPPQPAHALPVGRGAWLAAIAGFWIAVAALTGFLHGVELLAARLAFGRLVWFSREFVWMSPVAYAIVMAPGAIVLMGLAAAIRRTWTLSFAAAALVTVGTFGLLLPYSQISRWSAIILSLGVGVVAARAVNARPARWVRGAQRTAMAAVLVLAIIAPAQRAIRGARESRAVATLAAPPAGASNVLLIILDTVRSASMSLYSVTDSTTPRLNEWSNSSTVFDWAFSPSPWTLPSHGSLFTGAWAGEQSGDWERPLDGKLPTLAERFRDRGYYTGGFVANMHYTAWDSGLDRGFARFEDYVVNWRQLLFSSSYTQTELFAQLRRAQSFGDRVDALLERNLTIDPKHRFALKRGNEVTDAFLDWHEANRERPFFAFLNYFDGHQPYYAPPEFRRFTGEHGLDDYRAAISFLDAEMDRLLVALRQRGVLDNTLVVITSDHGELFGFKGLHGHAHNLYLNTVRVPLILRMPDRVAAGARVTRAVSLRDLAATIMDVAAPDAPPLPGVSLAATWRDAGDPSPVLIEVTRARNIESHYPTSRGDMQSLVDDRYQFIRNEGDGRQELYEYRVDSLLERDLAAADSSAGPAVTGIRQRLLDLLRNRR